MSPMKMSDGYHIFCPLDDAFGRIYGDHMSDQEKRNILRNHVGYKKSSNLYQTLLPYSTINVALASHDDGTKNVSFLEFLYSDRSR